MNLYHFEAFTSPCELHIEAHSQTDADRAAQSILEYVKGLEQRFSYFDEASEVFALNHRGDRVCTLSSELSDLIAIALFYTDITHGAFDIALAGTLKAASKAPSYDAYCHQVSSLLPYAASEHLHLEGNRLTFANEFTRIDLGGLVKEYAVDQAIAMLKMSGITSALVNFGGDIAAYGRCHDVAWRVGVEDPSSEGSIVREVDLMECSLCTSGHSKRYRMIDEKRITHIAGGKGTPHRYEQVSVIAPTTVDAGVWSTALLVNPDLTLPSHITIIHTADSAC